MRRHPLRAIVRRPALTRHLPQLGGIPAPEPILSDEDQQAYPELADDFRLLREELEGCFADLDAAALSGQNTFRLVNLLLILGGAAATVLGTLQAAAHAGKFWLGIFEAVLTGLLAPLAVVARNGRAHRAYFTTRLKAEQLRSEYFAFLMRTGEYDGLDPARLREVLRARVAAIADAEVGT